MLPNMRRSSSPELLSSGTSARYACHSSCSTVAASRFSIIVQVLIEVQYRKAEEENGLNMSCRGTEADVKGLSSMSN